MESYNLINYNEINEFHFGKNSNYEIFNGSYFEQINSFQENFIEKSIIKNIFYSPDITYIESDGNRGRCWCAQIIDNGLVNYYFRNFSHLVQLYEKKGYKFVKSN